MWFFTQLLLINETISFSSNQEVLAYKHVEIIEIRLQKNYYLEFAIL